MKLRQFTDLAPGLFMLLCLSYMLSACRGSEARMEGVPVKIVWEEDWCLVNPSGTLIYENMISGEISPIVNGCFNITDEQGSVGVYRATSAPRAISGLQGLKSAGYYSEGVIPVFTADGVLRVCDGFGRERFHLSEIGGSKVVAASAIFSEGILSVGNERGMWGAVDADGHLVVGARYAAEFMFHNGTAQVSLPEGSGMNTTYRTRFIDRKGHEVAAENFPVSGTVTEVSDTYIIYSDADGHRGLARKDGSVMLAPRYNSLEFGSGHLLLASNAQRYYLIDMRGNIVSDFNNADEVVYIGRWGVGRENGFGYAARFGSLWTLYDPTGNRTGRYDYVAIGRELLSGPEPIRAVASRGEELSGVDSVAGFPTLEFEADSVSAVADSLVFPPDSLK